MPSTSNDTTPSNDTTHSRFAAEDAAQRALAVTPRVDLLETENEFLVLADFPGVKPDEVDIRFEKGELSVHGRRTGREGVLTSYSRTFVVSETVATDKITADLKGGVLTIRLPKVEAVKPKKIIVSG
jgi:HSP20 family protein